MPDSIGGLPLHPLLVHFAVVLLPLSALGLLVLIAVPKWRRTFGWVVMAGLAASVAFSWAAKESGQNLAAVMGTPQEHAQWGDRLLPIAGLLFIAAALWFWQVMKNNAGVLRLSMAIVSAVLAVAAMAVVTIVGHTGAQAAWAARYAAVSAPAAAGNGSAASESTAPASPASSASSATQSPVKTISMTKVAKHSTASDCWTVVNGTVYDLTSWISQHPGGPSPIERMCGQDSTNAFTAQHGGQRTPTKVLAGFEIGIAG